MKPRANTSKTCTARPGITRRIPRRTETQGGQRETAVTLLDGA
jgi:hypothetical protein